MGKSLKGTLNPANADERSYSWNPNTRRPLGPMPKPRAERPARLEAL